VTEAEVIARLDRTDGEPRFTLGYGLCFGHNETKAIAMAVLDRAMGAAEPEAPSEDQEFVLTHVDGIESMGFCNHYKLPHYVTFQSDLDRLRHMRASQPPPGGPGSGAGGGRMSTVIHPCRPRRRRLARGVCGAAATAAPPSPFWTRGPNAKSGAGS
jgi:hypothetical protein